MQDALHNTAPARSEIKIGTVLRETYELTGLLGRGGMGSVFEARHLRLPGKSFAVKVLGTGPDIGSEIHARFRQEAEIIARLGHPNIVGVIDYNTLADGTPYLVLERLRGECLSQRLRAGPMPIDEALSIARQVGSALHSAHRAGIVHRDLKPANIFLIRSESGGMVSLHVKLLDFGISKIQDNPSSLHTQEEVLIGTPQYMSPEQALGKNRTVDARSDVFALGCIVYEMFSGRSPFAGDGIAEVVYKVVHREPTPLSELQPELAPRMVKAVEHALAKQVDARCVSVAAFVTELTGSPLKTLSNPDIPAHGMAAAPSDVSPAAPLDPTIGSPSRHSKRRMGSASATRRPLVAVAAVLGVGLVAFATGSWTGSWARWRKPAVLAAPPERSVVPTVVTTPAEAELPAETPEQTEDEPGEEGTPPGPRKPLKTSEKPLPPAALADLSAAEVALGTGDSAEALRLARRSQRQQPSGRAFAVLVRAHCLQGDLSNARAQYRHVPAAERSRVASFCKMHGIRF